MLNRDETLSSISSGYFTSGVQIPLRPILLIRFTLPFITPKDEIQQKLREITEEICSVGLGVSCTLTKRSRKRRSD